MKKKYSAPEIDFFRFRMENIIMTSDTETKDEYTGRKSLTKTLKTEKKEK